MKSESDESGTHSGASRVRAVRVKLLLMAALFIVPALLATLVFRFAPPKGGMTNYGELVEVRPIEGLEGTQLVPEDAPWRMDALRGRWIMVLASAGACPDNCERQLYFMRQVARAQGREESRIARLWLVTDGTPPAPARFAEHPGLVVARVDAREAERWFPSAEGYRQAIWLVDPHGNVMMRFPDVPEASRMIKDLKHLLKASQIG